ncbi:MAG: hypothetical protein LKJ69_10730 [Lactobacillus sp.]|jgi:hypothetical protein|nr:hypothetical protein [Lactobacillus sp.]
MRLDSLSEVHIPRHYTEIDYFDPDFAFACTSGDPSGVWPTVMFHRQLGFVYCHERLAVIIAHFRSHWRYYTFDLRPVLHAAAKQHKLHAAEPDGLPDIILSPSRVLCSPWTERQAEIWFFLPHCHDFALAPHQLQFTTPYRDGAITWRLSQVTVPVTKFHHMLDYAAPLPALLYQYFTPQLQQLCFDFDLTAPLAVTSRHPISRAVFPLPDAAVERNWRRTMALLSDCDRRPEALAAWATLFTHLKEAVPDWFW